MRSETRLYRAGKCDVNWPVLFGMQLVAEFPEFVWSRTPEQALAAIHQSICENQRHEIVVWDDSGTHLGTAIVVQEDDMHVGHCLSVQWRFVHPEHRGVAGSALQRRVIALARELDISVIAYTKCIGLARYELRYNRVRRHNGKEDQKDVG